MSLPEYALYIIPPAAGALIGYVTNKIAITMLFRPFREKRLLGLKIPFTPGIIPRQRYELSANIASQVSRELFTVETVGTQIRSDAFGESLEQTLSRWLERSLSLSIGELREFLRSGEGLLPEELTRLLREEGVRAARELIERICRSDFRLDGILNPRVRKLILRVSSGLLPYVRELVLEWLNRPDTREELHRRGILLMRDAVNSLPSIQRLLVVAGQYDRSMEERMSFLVDKVVISIEEAMKDKKTEKNLISAARGYLERFSSRPLNQVLDHEQQQRLGMLPELIMSPSEGDASSLDSLLAGFPPELSLGELLLPEAADRRGLVGWGRSSLTEITLKAVPGALAVMDVEKLVRNRIDSLDIERVESLLLAVIQKHLKWINLFGALLGALIGALQVLLQLLR